MDPTRAESNGSAPSWTPNSRSVCQDNPATGSANQHEAPPLIAIVGMGVRLPGKVYSPEDFWELMVNKKCASGPVPPERYNIDAFHGTPGVDTQSVIARKGYFLDYDYLGKVDTSFFQQNQYEHAFLDPQQTLLLEVVWECMESGGVVDWRGTDIGCFVGTFGEDWLDLSAKDSQHLSPLQIVGAGDYAASNRISYEYDLKGPSMTCRTACSSSLVALHEACQALILGDCPSAIVAGSSLIFTPTMTTNMSQGGALSPDGICKTFDASANGYARAEGVCAIYIKKLDDAIRDKDPIRGVIRAVATNFDGRTSHITVPSEVGQESLIRKAYQKARLAHPAETAFVECHGTATRAGDVAETTAIANAFGRRPMLIGGVKPNIGHTEGAAGLAGLIKAVLALEHKQIPPNVNFSTPNPEIMFEEGKLRVPLDTLPWPEGRKERVSINCFGVGGSNAHVIVDSASSVLQEVATMEKKDIESTSPRLLVLSAANTASLEWRTKATQDYLSRNPSLLDSTVYTLCARREHLCRRTFAVVDSSTPVERTEFITDSVSNPGGTVVFAFPGQGVQWPGMGCELVKQFPSFREDMETLDRVLQGLPDGPTWRIADELVKTGQDSIVDRAEVAQPLCTAVQLCLVNLLRSWGITPSKVIGHSSGESAAAYAAGAISIEAAITLAYYRGIVARIAPNGGGMLAVALGREDVTKYLSEDVILACENSPESVTLAGPRDQLEDIMALIKKDEPDFHLKMLPVEKAYHSPHMAQVAEKYAALIKPHLKANDSSTMAPMYSTVSEATITSPSDLGTQYWRRNLQSPVLFSTAFGNLVKSAGDKHLIIVEIGSHSALQVPIRQILRDSGAGYTYCPTMKRDEDNISKILSIAGITYLRQLPVDLPAVNGGCPRHTRTDLPPYPWQREVIPWAESRLGKYWRQRKFPRHELLGNRCLESSDLEPAWRNVLKAEEAPWIDEHRILGVGIFPAVGYLAVASEAMRQLTGSSDCTIRHVVLMEAMIRTDQDIEIMTTMRKASLNATMESSWYEFTVTSFNGRTWTKHCTGQAKAGPDQFPPSPDIAPPFSRHVASETWYRKCDKRGLEYGPQFRGLHDITACPSSNAARGRVGDDRCRHDSYYAIHPTAADQCLQVMLVASSKGVSHYPSKGAMPYYIDSVYLAPGTDAMLVEATSSDPREEGVNGYFKAISESSGNVVMEMSGIRLLSVFGTGLERKRLNLGMHIDWKPDIRFLPADRQTPSPVEFDGLMAYVKAAFLLLLDAAEAFKQQSSLPPHLVQYMEWIVCASRQVADGRYDYVPGVQEVVQMSQEERQEEFQRLRTAFPDSRMDRFFADSRRYMVDRVDNLVDGTAFQDMTLLESIKGLFEWRASLYDWTNFLGPICHLIPQLRILEIGAGTGSATATILDALTTEQGSLRFSQYHVTDLVPSCLGQLKQRFEAVPRMEFTKLDISQDPIQQGFSQASYDLVIACNVLYETPILRQSLEHIRSLLTPGGRLLMCEPSSDIPYFDALLGLFSSWWLGAADGRTQNPYVSVDRWRKDLHLAGFTGVDTFAYNPAPPFHWEAVMLSTNPVPDNPPRPIKLLCMPGTETCPWVQDVASNISRSGYTVQWSLFGETEQPDNDIIALLDVEMPFFDNISESRYEMFRRWITSSRRVLWITHSVQMACADPRFGLVLGLARTLRYELNIGFTTVEVDSFDDFASHKILEIYQQTVNATAPARDYEYIVHRGVVHTGRAIISKIEDCLQDTDQLGTYKLESDTYKLDINMPGDLSTIGWKPVKSAEIGPYDVEVQVRYFALNFKDLMVALGMVERSKTMDFIFEASGVITRIGSKVTERKIGDEVAVLHPKAMTSRGVFAVDEAVPIIKKLSLAEAAAIPSAYCTAICTLLEIGQLRKGQSVLVHSACGGVGLAALHVCENVGAKVFATVGSDEKVKYLMDNYGIPRSHIFDSHSSSFASGIMQQTGGRGVDLVLNSLAGELLRASWDCVAPFGKLLEIGKRDILGHGMLDMHGFQGSRSFCGFDLYNVFDAPDIAKRIVEAAVNVFGADQAQQAPYTSIHRADLSNRRPLYTVFKAENMEDALRYMQKGQHIGKIVIEMPKDGSELPLLPSVPLFMFPSTASYLLVGGLGGIGRVIARWMVDFGARSLVFLSRSGGHSEVDQLFCRELESQGCQVDIVQGSVSDATVVENAVSRSPYPIAGVIQLSTVLEDEIFDKMGHEAWARCLEPKVQGTWNLHHAVSKKQLDFFIVFGSVVSMIGNPSQANYAAANSFLDAFVQYRRGLGLPASLVSPGPVDEGGLMAEQPELLHKARRQHHQMMGEADVLKAFQLALLSAKDGLSSSRLGIMVTGLAPEAVVNDPWLQQDARFAGLATLYSAGAAGLVKQDEAMLEEQLASIKSEPWILKDTRCEQLIIESLGKLIASHNGYTEALDNDEYARFDVDSLMGLQIKHWLRRKVEVECTIAQISNAKTVGGIATLVADILREKYGVKFEGDR